MSLAEAQVTIGLWQTEPQLGIIRDEGKARLVVWLKYIKAVQTVDTSTVPDITWPVRAV
ncbi:tail fiber assembly protein [Erwinia tracheiphila]|uniref:tail fiber assembly protein n=1 Tax=Erwinia tracheiphila TaxID=65700 RepID=UPI00033E773B|nr:tail fiber assembly protein [Erwinia tracheiphila]EOS96619.1 tail fiber assembly protein [Erwinia tracheiphila PSU-1]UIA86567.1 tail fiber assembly protein [Erwinia tracheiphila]UIA94920.1 tail fiber assembly protein [Erwinia tracheiphila]